ncbi:MAG TPA: FMN-binding negative transcriptional regulator [Noviherbaspirillum sp.]
MASTLPHIADHIIQVDDMYVQQQFEETRPEVLDALVKAHSLATLVVQGNSGLLVNHIPLLLCQSVDGRRVLRGHVARANPLWRELSAGREAVAVFQGPDAYVTPSWYASKKVDGKVVPTWNYAVVHVHGVPRAIEDAPWLLAHLKEMSEEQERGEVDPWALSDAPTDYIERLLGAIVGIEIPVSKIIGKWKVSQNRPLADRLGVAAGLMERADDKSLAMAELVQQHAGNTPVKS